MEIVSTPVPILRATLAALVTLAMNWTVTDSTAQVDGCNCLTIYLRHTYVSVKMSTSASLVMEDVNKSVQIVLGTSAALVHLDTAWTEI